MKINHSVALLLSLLSLEVSAFDSPPTLANLDFALANQEAKFKDIENGSEKKIRWFKTQQQTDVALVYLHGFSASRQELSPVTERLADLIGANVYYARLRGHGRSGQAMTEGSVENWLEDTRQAYQIGSLIGKRVVLISASTGGTLATWLAAQSFTKELATSILVSPNFGVKSRSAELMKWSWGLRLAKWLNGPEHSFEPQNELHAKLWTERYPLDAVVPMLNLVDLVLDMDKSNITIPQLMIYSPNDQVINVDRISHVVDASQNSNITLAPFTESSDPSQHVLAGDACAPDATDAIVKIMASYLRQKLSS